ncbi:MAG: dihydropteroate synthase [Ignavibacteria bacterium]|nr:dihydropteroate synthase [Ignavibacteria bacterium]
MGILNVTPDSFSDGGIYNKRDNAVKYTLEMLDEGADIIDIGGESSRPGSDQVRENEELERVIPVVKEILNKRPESVISVDTTKSRVALAALNAGAAMVNDISALRYDPEMVNVIKHFDSAVALMHMKGKPKNMQENPYYENVIEEVYDFLAERSSFAAENGIDKIFIDPGIGFGKRVEDNINLIQRLEDFISLSYPIMIGFSRKSFIGKLLDLELDKRDEATMALNTLAISRGAKIIRTHNVKLGVQSCKLMNQNNLNS